MFLNGNDLELIDYIRQTVEADGGVDVERTYFTYLIEAARAAGMFDGEIEDILQSERELVIYEP